MNRVGNQKLNQTTAAVGWVFGVQLGLRHTQALITNYYIIIIITEHREQNELIERREEEEKKLNVLTKLSDDNDNVIGSM